MKSVKYHRNLLRRSAFVPALFALALLLAGCAPKKAQTEDAPAAQTENLVELSLSVLTNDLPIRARFTQPCAHEWETTILEEATCTKDGAKHIKCRLCGEEEDTVLCGEHRYVDHVCAECGDGEPVFAPVYYYERYLAPNDAILKRPTDKIAGYKLTAVGHFRGEIFRIPGQYKGLPVIEIADFAFVGSTGIKTVVLPQTMLLVDDLAFEGAADDLHIEAAKGPYAVYRVVNNCLITVRKQTEFPGFSNCWSGSSQNPGTLVKVFSGWVLPDDGSLSAIGYRAFYQQDITEISIPEGVTTIEEEAFFGCSALGSVSLPSTLRSIRYSAFRGCSALKTINFPEGLMTSGCFAFYALEGAAVRISAEPNVSIDRLLSGNGREVKRSPANDPSAAEERS